MAEIYNTMTSDMMTENPEVSKSSLGSSRQIGYLYKGMTPEEKEIFRAAQLAQIEEQKVIISISLTIWQRCLNVFWRPTHFINSICNF